MAPQQLTAMELTQELIRFRDLLTTLSLQLHDYRFDVDHAGREAVGAEVRGFLQQVHKSAG